MAGPAKSDCENLLFRSGLALVLLFLVSTKFVDITIGAGFGCHPAETAWAATGLVADHFSLDYWVTAPNRSVEENLEAVARRIGARLGVAKPAVFVGQADGIRYANLDGDLPHEGELVLTIQAERAVLNIGVSCCYARLPPDLLALERRVRLSLAGIGSRGTFYWTIRAQQAGHVRDEVWRAMWVRVLASVNAIRRGHQPGENVIEAYTPFLPSSQPGQSDGVNLVLVSQYDQARRVSLIALASPSLGEEI